jgi:hypothetical protein
MSEIRQITLRGATGQYRTAVFENKDYVVVPVIALVEGVIRAMNAKAPEFVSAESFSVAPAGWDGRPVMHNHPTIDGKPVSANSPNVLESYCFGKVFNTKVENKQLKMEGWLDIAKAAALGGEVQKTVDRILDGKSVEVSVGVFVTAEEANGSYHGKNYEYVWRDLVPDHLAFLEEGHIGACSNEMGCGVRAAAVHTITAEGMKPMSEAVAKRTLRERLKDIMPFRSSAKGYSDVDVRDALREAVRSQEPLLAYIESVFESDGYFIYCTMSADPNVYEEHYYKRTFSLDKSSGEITLGAERTEVEPVVKFEPLETGEGQLKAACSCEHNEDPPMPSEKEENMSRNERIQALIANANCPIKEQVALEALSDAGLALLEEKVAAVVVPIPAPVPQPTAATAVSAPAPQAQKTEAQWLEEAPAHVREMIARHAEQDAATKKELVDALKTAQKTYSEDELNAMDIAQLSKISDLIQVDAPRAAVDFSARNPLPRAAKTETHVPTAWDSVLGKDGK